MPPPDTGTEENVLPPFTFSNSSFFRVRALSSSFFFTMILEFLIVKLIVFFSFHSDVVFSDDDAKLRRFFSISKKFPDFFSHL